ncbi:MAG: porin [Gallionella sp.]|nr:porin [Gallionella sp.]
MQKKIIALAIASALVAPVAAMADTGGNVGLYGQVNLSAERINDGATTNSKSTSELVNNASRLGVAGNEDIGGGLTAMFQAEGSVDQASGSNTFTFDRNTFLGLKSADFGTALAGRYDSAYKISTRSLDLFADDTAADNRGLAGVTLMGNGHDARRQNSINYMSPSMGGFSVAGAVAKQQTAAEGSTVSLAGMYGMEGMYATLAYDKTKAIAGASGKAFKLGGSYAIDAFKINAVVEKTTDTTTAGDTKGTNLYLGGKYSLSSTDAVKLAFTKRGDAKLNGGAATNNAKQVTVGYDHEMSKRTSVYALYNKVTQAATNAADPSTVAVGMKHAF